MVIRMKLAVAAALAGLCWIVGGAIAIANSGANLSRNKTSQHRALISGWEEQGGWAWARLSDQESCSQHNTHSGCSGGTIHPTNHFSTT